MINKSLRDNDMCEGENERGREEDIDEPRDREAKTG